MFLATQSSPCVGFERATDVDLIPPTADDCKEEARTTFHVDGVRFKNQGDCVSFFETSGKNPHAGG